MLTDRPRAYPTHAHLADADELMAELGHMQEELELQRAAFEEQCVAERAAERAEQEAMTREDRERRSAAARGAPKGK